jgi:hypothetical protein
MTEDQAKSVMVTQAQEINRLRAVIEDESEKWHDHHELKKSVELAYRAGYQDGVTAGPDALDHVEVHLNKWLLEAMR